MAQKTPRQQLRDAVEQLWVYAEGGTEPTEDYAKIARMLEEADNKMSRITRLALWGLTYRIINNQELSKEARDAAHYHLWLKEDEE